MALADIKAKTIFNGAYSDDQKAALLAIMENAYTKSATAKAMFDAWFADAAHKISFTFVANDAGGYVGEGRVDYDPGIVAKNGSYIDSTGKAVAYTNEHIVLHELAHALHGTRDNWTNAEYKGDNVKYTNLILSELGVPQRISYIASDVFNKFITTGYDYANGAKIDAAVAWNDGNWNSSNLGVSNDLLISGSGSNSLDGGAGDDLFAGNGGNDTMNGGDGTDTAIYQGSALDYDIRLAADGSWIIKNVRGAKTDGNDTLLNIEKARFSDGTFDLKAHGLKFQTDFALVIDNTGSMGSSIGSVKTQAAALLDAAFANGKADARVGVVTFQGHDQRRAEQRRPEVHRPGRFRRPQGGGDRRHQRHLGFGRRRSARDAFRRPAACPERRHGRLEDRRRDHAHRPVHRCTGQGRCAGR